MKDITMKDITMKDITMKNQRSVQLFAIFFLVLGGCAYMNPACGFEGRSERQVLQISYSRGGPAALTYTVQFTVDSIRLHSATGKWYCDDLTEPEVQLAKKAFEQFSTSLKSARFNPARNDAGIYIHNVGDHVSLRDIPGELDGTLNDLNRLMRLHFKARLGRHLPLLPTSTTRGSVGYDE